MQKLKAFLLSLSPVFRNIFFLTGLAFVVWMSFFDENNMMVQYSRWHELKALQMKTRYYKHEISIAEQKYDELTTNTSSQEKFARENYMMKKDNEDVFVIVNK